MKLYQVDAFADALFAGNPAAVCPVAEWPATTLMQRIAAENNLSETAFIVGHDGEYRLRWFTPMIEVDLCGHATLAAAHVVFNYLEPALSKLSFASRSGPLYVERDQACLTMDFPVAELEPCSVPAPLLDGLGLMPTELYRGVDYMAVLEHEHQVRELRPDFRRLAELDCRGIIVTAPGVGSDFVSRFFAPRAGIDEDPVTGSAHCALAPYWAGRLGRKKLFGRQLSARGGKVHCQLVSNVHGEQRVRLSGNCVTYMVADLFIGDGTYGE